VDAAPQDDANGLDLTELRHRFTTLVPAIRPVDRVAELWSSPAVMLLARARGTAVRVDALALFCWRSQIPRSRAK